MRFEYLEEMRRFVQWRVGDAVLLGEANVPPDESQTYFSERGGLHMMFNFWVNQHAFYALASADARPLAQGLRATRRLPLTAQFLRNHDELDLGRLTKEQQAAVFERFGPEQRMQLYDRGICRRLAPMLGERRRLELAYSLMFSLPGTPVIYYGDEIGMGDDLALAERHTVRTPMQWSSDRNAGFSTAEKLVSPVISGGPYGYEQVNVERQQRDQDSFLRWMTRMIRLRTQCPEIGWGDWKLVPTRSQHVLAVLYRWRGSALLCVHNFDEQPHEVTLRLAGEDADRLVDLISEDHSVGARDGVHRVSLDAYGYRWYSVGRPEAVPQRRISS